MKFPQSNLGKRSAFAFTIIELLVAITITAAISAMMVTIVTNVLGAWSRSSATLSTGNQARLILDQIAVDLQGAVLRSSTDVTFAATIQKAQSGSGDANVTDADWSNLNSKPSAAISLELNPTDRDLTAYRFGHAGVWLRLFTVPSDNRDADLDNQSAPRAISYQVIRKRVGSSSAPYTYQLFRSEVRPYGTSATTIARSTFSNGYDLFGANGYNNPALASGGTAQGDAGMIRRPSAAYVIGNGVVDFGVRIFSRNTAGALEEAFPFDRRSGSTTPGLKRVFAASTDVAKLQPNSAFATANDYTAAQTSYGYPAVVEVMLRILTPEGVQIIQSYEDDPNRFGGASAAKWWELAEQNSKVYVRRVEIRSTAL